MKIQISTILIVPPYTSVNMYISIYEPSRWKTNIVDSIDPDQPKHAAQAYPYGHFSLPVDFLFQESLLYTSIPRRRNVSARISLRGLRRLIWVDTLCRCHNVGFSRGTALIWICLHDEITDLWKHNHFYNYSMSFQFI